MSPIIYIIVLILNIISFALIIWIILSWLISFRIVNAHQPFVYRVNEALNQLFEPMLRPIRRLIPRTGMIDFSPIILILIIEFIRYSLRYYF